MSDVVDPALWKAQAVQPPGLSRALSAEEVRQRATALRRRVRRRNLLEYATAALMIVACAMLIALQVRLGRFDAISIGLALLAAGGGVIAWQLHQRTGSPVVMDGARPSLDVYRDALRRERDALASVASWYVLPAVPGMAAIYIGAFLRVPPASWPLLIVLVLGTFALFAWVIRLNRRGARTLDDELRQQEQA
ncbi:MAG: hypothetical protein DI568_10005 [Sphingomonas sp.]|nr:MAG: hypothetical protein DI568_10005 [Sphingomonas sp.]